jgi:hypothetical protein
MLHDYLLYSWKTVVTNQVGFFLNIAPIHLVVNIVPCGKAEICASRYTFRDCYSESRHTKEDTKRTKKERQVIFVEFCITRLPVAMCLCCTEPWIVL